MNAPIAAAIAILLWLVLTGTAVLRRRRRGEPIARYGLIWAVLLALAFAAAMVVDRHHGG